MAGTSDAEDRCPLCPPSGPPLPSAKDPLDLLAAAATNAEPADDDGPDFIWISCSRCAIWFHSVCLLMGNEKPRETVPLQVREEIVVNHAEEGAWTNWVGWIDKWYCSKCLLWAVDPTNPRPTRFPLVSTLKRDFPPKPKLPAAKPRKSLKRSPSSSSLDPRRDSPVIKRTRVDSERKSEVNSEEPSHHHTNGHLPTADIKLNGSSVNGDLGTKGHATPNGHVIAIGNKMIIPDPPSEGINRPKRQAALNRPDYHALHHHIATPTGKWLQLIGDPEKYGKVIKEDGFPRLPGRLVSRAWIESPAPTISHTIPPSIASSSRHSSPLSPPPGASSLQPVDYPPHLPPTLFYGPNRQPLIIGPEDGGFESLGGKLPSKDLNVQDIARLVGPDRMVDVIDVASQSSAQWTLAKWADSIAAHSRHQEPGSSTPSKVYNVISLEITGTELAKRVRPPQLVRDIDWVDNFWRFGPGGKSGDVEVPNGDNKPDMHGVVGDLPDMNRVANATVGQKGKAKAEWPKVQLYCLMGMRGSWTDWHIDFAASSVYYTVHTGAKTFFFIRPTEKNLAAYAEWSGSYEKQQEVWLGDMCDEVRRVTVRAGDTMIIPSGYIHAVYTPMDSIVFGGNFLHSYDVHTQLRLRQIEIDTKVPQRFRFPHFDRLCWYVADRYCADLRHLRAYRPRAQSSPGVSPHSSILDGLHHLATFLLEQVAVLEDPDAEDKRRKAVYDKIPGDVLRDPAGLAKELEWRVERELPRQTAEDEPWDGEKQVNGKRKPQATTKKQRGMMMLPPVSRTWQFEPAPWLQHNHSPEISTLTLTKHRPNAELKTLNAKPEQAMQTQTVFHQAKLRVGELDDGTTVLEEQDVVYTERRIVWNPRQEEMGDKEVQNFAGEKGSSYDVRNGAGGDLEG